DSVPSEIYTLSLHDALPIFSLTGSSLNLAWTNPALLSRSMSGNVALNFTNYLAGVNYGMALYSHSSGKSAVIAGGVSYLNYGSLDRKSTRLNSSHVKISYAV